MAKTTRKPASEWTVLGKPIGRPDMADMVMGTFEFAHNVKRPGMLHGMVIRPSAVGANLMNVDESSVAGMPGLVKVVVKKNFVGVVADWTIDFVAARFERYRERPRPARGNALDFALDAATFDLEAMGDGSAIRNVEGD